MHTWHYGLKKRHCECGSALKKEVYESKGWDMPERYRTEEQAAKSSPPPRPLSFSRCRNRPGSSIKKGETRLKILKSCPDEWAIHRGKVGTYQGNVDGWPRTKHLIIDLDEGGEPLEIPFNHLTEHFRRRLLPRNAPHRSTVPRRGRRRRLIDRLAYPEIPDKP